MNNNLFGKGREKILECFYKKRNKELYFSEILRETGLTPNTTLKHLTNLKKMDLITSNKKIGNTFYSINPKNPEVYAVFSYFDYKRLNDISYERKSAIKDFLKKSRIKPLIVVLFGSTAKKSYQKKSDIDLLLIYNKKEKKEKKLLEDIEAVTGTKLQIFTIDFNYLRNQIKTGEDAVISHAIKTGFPIKGNCTFYEEILNG